SPAPATDREANPLPFGNTPMHYRVLTGGRTLALFPSASHCYRERSSVPGPQPDLRLHVLRFVRTTSTPACTPAAISGSKRLLFPDFLFRQAYPRVYSPTSRSHSKQCHRRASFSVCS